MCLDAFFCCPAPRRTDTHINRQTPPNRRQVTASIPFNTAVALAFYFIFYGMAGLRRGTDHVVRGAVIAVLMALTASQVGGWGLGVEGETSVMIPLLLSVPLDTHLHIHTRAPTLVQTPPTPTPQAVYCCATVAPTQDIAFMLAIGWTALNLLACGYFQRFASYSLPGLTFIRYISAMNWAWEGLVREELGGRVFSCAGGGDPGLSALGIYIGEKRGRGGHCFALGFEFEPSIGAGRSAGMRSSRNEK